MCKSFCVKFLCIKTSLCKSFRKCFCVQKLVCVKAPVRKNSSVYRLLVLKASVRDMLLYIPSTHKHFTPWPYTVIHSLICDYPCSSFGTHCRLVARLEHTGAHRPKVFRISVSKLAFQLQRNIHEGSSSQPVCIGQQLRGLSQVLNPFQSVQVRSLKGIE